MTQSGHERLGLLDAAHSARMKTVSLAREINPVARLERSATFTTEMPSQLLNFTHCYRYGWGGSWKIGISPSSLGGLVAVAYRRESLRRYAG